MHEMGIAAEVLRLACKEAAAAGAQRIVGLELRVGRWSGVEVESLRFAISALSDETAAEGARLEIDVIEPRFRCPRCEKGYTAKTHFEACPECGALGGVLTAGDEMTLVQIEVDP